jgi:hypothetical protein
VVVGIVLVSAAAGFAVGRVIGPDGDEDLTAVRGGPGQHWHDGENDGPGDGFDAPYRDGIAVVGQVTSVEEDTITVWSHGDDVTVIITEGTVINGATDTDLSTLQDELVMVEGMWDEDGTVTADVVESHGGQPGGPFGATEDVDVDSFFSDPDLDSDGEPDAEIELTGSSAMFLSS